MVNLQITYNDLENLIETAREDSPYLVYSYKLRKMPNPSGYNKLNDKSVIVCWVGKEEIDEKESVALVILSEKESLEIHKNCLYVRKNGGKIKYAKYLHDYFNEKLIKINYKLENSAKKELKKYNPTNWFPVVKLSYPVKVLDTRSGTEIKCPITGTQFRTTRDVSFVVTGVCGEKSPISPNELKSSYVTREGERIDDAFLKSINYEEPVDLIFSPSNIKYFAKKITDDDFTSHFTSEYSLILASQLGFNQKFGDYIVTTESDFNNVGDAYTLVNGLVFEKTYKLLKEELLDPKIKAEVTKRFIKKKDYYIAMQKQLLSYGIGFYLKRNTNSYKGMAADVLKCKADIVGKNVFKNNLTNLELVTTGTRDYIVPKGFGFLVRGAVSEQYYQNFLKDEQALDRALQTGIACSEKYAEFAAYVDELQDEVDYQTALKEYENEKNYNSKTILGKLQNVFLSKPRKGKNNL